MVEEDSAKASPEASPKGASCKGLLYLSSSGRKATAHNPLCIGITRPQDEGTGSVDDSRADAAKHIKALHHFKYACVGYSTYRKSEAMPSNVRSESTKHAKLPICSGLEIFVEGGAPDTADTARQGHWNENIHRSNEGAPPIIPRPPSTIRPPSGITGVPPDEFGTKFIRSAGLVAGAVTKNLSQLGNSIKNMIGDIFHSDGGGSK